MAHFIVDWLCIKIVDKTNKKFAIEAKAKQVVLEVVVVDSVDGVDEFDRIDKHRGIALS